MLANARLDNILQQLTILYDIQETLSRIYLMLDLLFQNLLFCVQYGSIHLNVSYRNFSNTYIRRLKCVGYALKGLMREFRHMLRFRRLANFSPFGASHRFGPPGKQTVEYNNSNANVEQAICGDVTTIRAHKVDFPQPQRLYSISHACIYIYIYCSFVVDAPMTRALSPFFPSTVFCSEPA